MINIPEPDARFVKKLIIIQIYFLQLQPFPACMQTVVSSLHTNYNLKSICRNKEKKIVNLLA